jgi:hypothetical protein
MMSDAQYVRPRADTGDESTKGYTGWEWIQSLSSGLDAVPPCEYLRIDLSNLRHIGMYELVSCVALLERHIRRNTTLREIGFDFTGDRPANAVTQEELVRARKGSAPRPGARHITTEMLERAQLWERLQAFVESLGTGGALDGIRTEIGRNVRIVYPYLGSGYGGVFKYSDAARTVISGISRVDGADACAELLSGAAIHKR